MTKNALQWTQLARKSQKEILKGSAELLLLLLFIQIRRMKNIHILGGRIHPKNVACWNVESFVVDVGRNWQHEQWNIFFFFFKVVTCFLTHDFNVHLLTTQFFLFRFFDVFFSAYFFYLKKKVHWGSKGKQASFSEVNTRKL